MIGYPRSKKPIEGEYAKKALKDMKNPKKREICTKFRAVLKLE